MVHQGLDDGIGLIDTADPYSRCEAESIVREALQGNRDSVVVATNVLAANGEGPEAAERQSL